MGSIRTRKNYLPKTGFTVSYHDYDDGYYQKGSNISPRFIDVGDGTVIDRVTNLMWVKDPRYMIPGAMGVTSNNFWTTYQGTWTNSTSYTKGVIVLDGDNSTYWICAVNHTSANSGSFANDRAANPTYWRFTDWVVIGKGDPLLNGQTFNSVAPKVASLQFAGYNDWRIPNLLEALSIFDLSSCTIYSPLVYNYTPYGTQFWTSTPVCGKSVATYLYAIDYYAYSGGNIPLMPLYYNSTSCYYCIVRSI